MTEPHTSPSPPPPAPTAAVAVRSPLDVWQTGDAWVHGVTGMHLRVERAAAETGGAATEWAVTFARAVAPPPMHLHPRQREVFNIRAGRMRVLYRGGQRDFAAGETLEIAPGEAHAMWNPSEAPAVVSWRTAPALRTERWMGMLLALAAAGRTNERGVPGVLQLAVLLRAYANEIRLCQPSALSQAFLFTPAAWLGHLCGLRPDKLP